MPASAGMTFGVDFRLLTRPSKMAIIERDDTKHVTISPGEYYVSDQNVVISTLLGSCISACLYDPHRRVVGMNHFLLSSRRYSKSAPVCITEAGRYGIQAMELVINGMLKVGANRNDLKAKVFGGGSFFRSPDESENFYCVGEANSRFILEFLKTDGIPLVAHDLGGKRGRTIRFSSDDYSVTVKKTKTINSPTLLEKEKQFWRKSIELNEQNPEEPDIWI
jgi:chemotaxis protein CheD